MERNQNVALITPFELALVEKLQKANFPPATATKTFVKGLSESSKLSDRGRRFLARSAQRFRRQYTLTEEQWAWVRLWAS